MLAYPMISFVAVLIGAIGVLLVRKSLVLPYTLLVIFTIIMFFIL